VPSAVGVLQDPFGMGDFGNHDSGDPSQQELENAIGLLDKRLLEMKVKCLVNLQHIRAVPRLRLPVAQFSLWRSGFSYIPDLEGFMM